MESDIQQYLNSHTEEVRDYLAKKDQRRRSVCLRYIKGTITCKEAAEKLGVTSGGIYSIIVNVIREEYKEGRVNFTN
jgi:transposase